MGERQELPLAGQPITVELKSAIGEHLVLEGLVREAGEHGVALSFAAGAEAAGLLASGIKALVRYADEDGLRWFEAPLLDWSVGERLELRLAAPKRVSTSQRRRFMRLGMRLPIACSHLDRQGEPSERLIAYTLELGGNGAGIVAERPFRVGERVGFELDLGEWGLCAGIATVKRSVLALRPEGPEHRVALQFTEVGSKAHALILSYLLAARRASR